MSKKHESVSYASYTKPVFYSEVEWSLQFLTGKILTIIDGAITNDKQNKAVKDQIKGEVYEQIRSFQEKTSDGKAGHSVVFPD